MHQGASLYISAPGVLGNDSDADQDPLTAELISDVSDGYLFLEEDGSFSYDPDSGFVGTDSFDYKVFDGTVYSNTVTVQITVSNIAPVAAADTYEVHQGDSLYISTPGVLGNDSDADQDELIAELVSGVSNGYLFLEGDGSFSYDPNSGFVGTDSFIYRVSDGAEYSNTVTVTINVTNQAPVAVADTYQVHHGDSLYVSAPGVLGDDSDADQDDLTAELVSGVSNGYLFLENDGSFSYDPNSGYTGSESFSYRVYDGAEYSNTVTVTIDVTNGAPEFDAPSDPDTYSFNIDENSGYAGAPVGTVAAADPDNDALTYDITDGNPAGIFAIDANTGAITVFFSLELDYETMPQYVLTVGVNDGNLSDDATVTINVNDVNEAPVFTSGATFTVQEHNTLVTTLTATDPDNNPITYAIAGGLDAARFEIDASTGTLSFATAPDYEAPNDWGSDNVYDVMVQVSDGNLFDLAQLAVTVTNLNEFPVVYAIADQSDIEARMVTPVQVSATDPEGSALTYGAAGLPNGLTIDLTTGVISGTPTYTSSGNHNVTVTVTDGTGLATTQDFVWAVADATIGTFKGTELNGGTVLPNSVTAAGIATTVLYISPGNTVKLEVAAPVGGNLPLWADILYAIDGTGASPASGNFAGAAWPVTSFSGAATNYVVKAGTDLNNDDSLQISEVSHLFYVRVINFTGSQVRSQRVGGGPVESAAYPILFGERFEVGGEFQFTVTGGVAGGPNSMIRYELINVLNGDTTAGWGTSFTHTFPTDGVGGYHISFFADKNNDGIRNWSEPTFLSQTFKVHLLRVYNITFSVSTAIPNQQAFANLIPGFFDAADELILRKDAAEDYRAAVKFNATLLGYFGPSVRPDPSTSAADDQIHFNANSDVEFINSSSGRYGGLAVVGDWHKIIIDYTSYANAGANGPDWIANAIAHEMGHGVGLYHHGTSPYLMQAGVLSGSDNVLTVGDATAFEDWASTGAVLAGAEPTPFVGAPAAHTLRVGDVAGAMRGAEHRMMAPGLAVNHVDALFALAGSLGQHAGHVENLLLFEARALPASFAGKRSSDEVLMGLSLGDVEGQEKSRTMLESGTARALKPRGDAFVLAAQMEELPQDLLAPGVLSALVESSNAPRPSAAK